MEEKIKNNMSNHLTILSVLLIIVSIIQLFLALGFNYGFPFIGEISNNEIASTVLGTIGKYLGFLFMFLAIAFMSAGIGLLNKKSWARILSLIVCILSLFSIPFGTCLGIYGIYVLMKDETMELFK